MGIKGLHNIIRKYSPDSMTITDISNYKFKKIGIDSEILMYKFRTYAYKQKECEPEFYHIYAFLMNVIYHLSNGVIPVYVFDGIPPVSKQENCLVKRSEIKERNRSKILELEDKFIDSFKNFNNSSELLGDETFNILDQILKSQSSNPEVTKVHRHQCKYFLKLLGIPMISNGGEAEALCVKMARQNLVDYVYTEDSDAITYAAASYLTEGFCNDIKILKKSRTNYQNFIETNVNKVLSDLKMTPGQFLDFCILSGCDYCKNISKIGPITSMKIINEYKSIENYSKIRKLDINFEEVRDIFMEPEVVLPTFDQTCITDTNIEELEKFLNDEMKTNPIPIISKYKKALQDYKVICYKYNINTGLN